MILAYTLAVLFLIALVLFAFELVALRHDDDTLEVLDELDAEANTWPHGNVHVIREPAGVDEPVVTEHCP